MDIFVSWEQSAYYNQYHPWELSLNICRLWIHDSLLKIIIQVQSGANYWMAVKLSLLNVYEYNYTSFSSFFQFLNQHSREHHYASWLDEPYA